MKDETRKQAADRLARLEGQLRGIKRMVNEDAYCIDVLTQLSSISAAIDGLGLVLLNDHVRTCISRAVRSGDAEAKYEELATALERFVRA